jgi:two-component system, OmpR family, phosphate regulon response regulator PhoB
LALNDTSLLKQVRVLCPEVRVFSLDAYTAEISSQDPVSTNHILCFVDWVLPEYSGLEVCRRLRLADGTKSAHINMVMESRDDAAQRRAIRAGADSYIWGPLSADMIVQKIQSYRGARHDSKITTKLTHGKLTVDLDAYKVSYLGRNIALTPNEFRVLTHFIENPDRLLTRRSIIEMLGKDTSSKNGEPSDERIVNVWIRRLRRALNDHHIPDPLRTVRSKGYVMDSIQN